MASYLAGLNDVNFKKDQRPDAGPLEALSGTQYAINTHKYPADVGGSLDKGHYVTFFVNSQKRTQFATNLAQNLGDDLPTIVKNRKFMESMRGATNIGGGIENIANKLKGGAASAEAVGQEITKAAESIKNQIDGMGISKTFANIEEQAKALFNGTQSGKSLSEQAAAFKSELDALVKSAGGAIDLPTGTGFVRTINRTTESVTLYMPDTLQFDYRQNFSDLQTNAGLIGQGIAGVSSIIEALKKQDTAGELGNLAAFFGTSALTDIAGSDAVTAAAATALGLVKNPGLELLYSSPEFRTFQFDFRFHPRDENEAREVMRIIDSLRYHQAPEIKGGTGGYFLVPPSEFDIKFYYNGVENPNIDRVSTCVMTNLMVNYAPEGFSAYEVPGQLTPGLGATGTPVTIQLTMMFKETQIVTKETFRTPLSTGGPKVTKYDNGIEVTETDQGKTTYFGP